jgi:signal transduction histidine kinase/CheY-like chemotaxis protein
MPVPSSLRWWFLVLLLLPVAVLATTLAARDVQPEKTVLAKMLEYREDPSGQLNLAQILADRQLWRMQPKEIPHFGYSTSAFWLRVTLHNGQAQPINRLLEIAYPLLDDVRVYLVNGQGQIVQQQVFGDNLPFHARPIDHRLFLLPVTFDAGQIVTLYVRVASSSGLQVPLTLWEPWAFSRHDNLRLIALGFFYGSLLIMGAYNLFLWASIRDRSYLYYFAFVVTFSAMLASIDGFFYQYWWPDQVWWNNKTVVVFLNLLMAFGLLTSRYFLQTQHYAPRIDIVLKWLMWLMFVMVGADLYVPYRTMIVICIVMSVFVCVLIIGTSVLCWKRGNRAARFFLLSWGVLATMIILYDLGQLAIMPKSTFTNIALQLGEMCEVLLLSFALADRINIARQEKIAAQELAFEEERRANAEREEHLHTKLMAQEEEIRSKRALDQAQTASRAKSMFLATMSHEIRTPMNGVLGMTELLQDTELSLQQQQFVQVIHSSGNALLNVINDILDYSKIEADKMDIEHIDMDLDHLLLECASIFSLTAEQKRLEFLASIEPQTPMFIKADPTRLRQILLNLLSNAFKFTHRGRITLRIHTITHNQQSLLRFEVTDTGIGMTNEQQERLFEAFSQGDISTTRKFGGTGLGLSISKRLVDLMNGYMKVHSQIGHGSCFEVCIPCEPASADFVEDHFVPLTALQGQRVLFVDDSVEFAQIMTEQAVAWGMIADAVHDGEHALALMLKADGEHKPYDMVVLDMRMPRMSGLEVAQEMARNPALADIKRILLTAMRIPPSKEELASVGLHLVLQKPTSANVLRNALLELLGCQEKYRSTSEKRQSMSIVQRMLQGKRLLIAEDNAVNQMVVLGMLKKLGISATVAQHGMEALTIYKAHPSAYDLILMDCEMPELDGYQTTEAIRLFEQEQQLSAVKIVALTAHAMRDQQLRCLKVGMDDFLTKPLAFERLKQMLMQMFWQADNG